MPAAVLVLIDLAGLLFLILAYAVTRGTLAAWEHTLGGLLQWMHDHLSIRVPLGWFGHATVDLGKPFGAANHYMVRLLQHAADREEWAIGKLWHGLGELARWTVATIDEALRESKEWARWSHDVFVPALIHAATHPLATALRALRATVAETVHAAHVVTRTVRTIDHTLEHTITRVVVKAVPAVVHGAPAIPGLLVNWRGLTRRLARLERRMHKAEALVGATAMAAVMANVLGVRARCLRGRGPVARVARRLCGLGPHALEDLLGLMVDVLLVEDICQVLPLMVEGFGLIEGPLTAFIGVADGALCHGDYKPPPKLRTPGLSLPPAAAVAGVLV